HFPTVSARLSSLALRISILFLRTDISLKHSLNTSGDGRFGSESGQAAIASAEYVRTLRPLMRLDTSSLRMSFPQVSRQGFERGERVRWSHWTHNNGDHRSQNREKCCYGSQRLYKKARKKKQPSTSPPLFRKPVT